LAYGDDIANLNADHHWPFDGDLLDAIGSENGSGTGVSYGVAIAEDSTNSVLLNATTDQVSVADNAEMNFGAKYARIVCGWFMVTAFQSPPKYIYGEGETDDSFHFVMFLGNQIMLELTIGGTNNMQIFADRALQPNRAYHLTARFSGNAYDNELSLFLDGVKQTDAIPVDREPDVATFEPDTNIEFGASYTTQRIGNQTIEVNACVNSNYAHWASWHDADAEAVTETDIRETLFEKGALPDTTISSGTQSAMQTSLDALADTERDDAPLCIRVEAVTGDGDVELEADNITFDPLASIHVQYMGTGTLTWKSTNGGSASIGSTPNGGTIVFVTEVTLTINVKALVGGAAVNGARVYIEAAAGGSLTAGDLILSTTTNASGVATTTFDYSSNQPVLIRIRQGSSSPYYIGQSVTATIRSTGLNQTFLLVSDEG
jgi:hypothetical protein